MIPDVALRGGRLPFKSALAARIYKTLFAPTVVDALISRQCGFAALIRFLITGSWILPEAFTVSTRTDSSKF